MQIPADTATHNHSIVIIRDTFRAHPNRYLVYQDFRWNCLLFLNYKENVDNEGFLASQLSRELMVPRENIRLEFMTQQTHSKFSESAKEIRMYRHRFYRATIFPFPTRMLRDMFQTHGRSYFWKTIPELERDPEVQKKNLDVVGFVRNLTDRQASLAGSNMISQRNF